VGLTLLVEARPACASSLEIGRLPTSLSPARDSFRRKWCGCRHAPPARWPRVWWGVSSRPAV